MMTLMESIRRKKELLGLPMGASLAEVEEKIHKHNQGQFFADAVYGSLDGIVTTFAIVSGADGAGLSIMIMVVLGFANLFADGFSMAVGNFLAKRSENEYYKKQHQIQAWELQHFKPVELEELKNIYKAKGFKGKQLDAIVETISSNKKLWIQEILQDELGILPVDHRPLASAMVTFGAFVSAGFMPLIPIMIWGNLPFIYLVAYVALVLFCLGSLRSKLTSLPWWRSGLEVMAGGIGASLIAFFIGVWLQGLVN